MLPRRLCVAPAPGSTHYDPSIPKLGISIFTCFLKTSGLRIAVLIHARSSSEQTKASIATLAKAVSKSQM